MTLGDFRRSRTLGEPRSGDPGRGSQPPHHLTLGDFRLTATSAEAPRVAGLRSAEERLSGCAARRPRTFGESQPQAAYPRTRGTERGRLAATLGEVPATAPPTSRARPVVRDDAVCDRTSYASYSCRYADVPTYLRGLSGGRMRSRVLGVS